MVIVERANAREIRLYLSSMSKHENKDTETLFSENNLRLLYELSIIID